MRVSSRVDRGDGRLDGRERATSPSGDVRAAWETNAEWWDAYYKEGNDFHLALIAPPTERMLAIEPGETVLDVACGNGAFSRRMAQLGATVVAFDFSEPSVECARKRTTEHADRIEYRVLDATDRDALLSLGEGRFDAAVCTMAIMDMEEIDSLAEVLPLLLKPSGRFVFSILHPCFNNPSCRMSAEQDPSLTDSRGFLGPRCQGNWIFGRRELIWEAVVVPR